MAIRLHLINLNSINAELHLIAFNSKNILSRHLIEKGCARTRELFEKFNPKFTESDYHIRCLAIHGLLASYASERFEFGKLDIDKAISVVIQMALSSFNIPQEIIIEEIRKAHTIVHQNNIELFSNVI